MGRFFLDKFFKGIAYKKLKVEDSKDVEIKVNLGFVNFNWQIPDDPTTLKNESRGTFEKFVGRN